MRFERRERSRAGHARRRTRAAYAGLVALSAAVLPGCSGSSEPAESPYESGRIGVDGVLAMAHLGAGFVDAWLGLPPGVAADVWILDEDVYGGPVAAVFRGAAPDEILASLIGGGAETMHGTLAREFGDGDRWRLHYVTAREMFNVARAAMDGKGGEPSAWYDYDVLPPPVVA